MNEKVVCPKCNSDQLTANQKGYSAGKGVAGAVLTGGIGLIAGFHGSKDIIVTCLACGNKFKAGQGRVIKNEPTISSKYVESNTSWYRKCSCDNICFDTHRYCFKCGRELDFSKDMVELKIVTYPLITCKNCGKLAVRSGGFCPYCKAEVQVDKGGCAAIALLIVAAGTLSYFLI